MRSMWLAVTIGLVTALGACKQGFSDVRPFPDGDTDTGDSDTDADSDSDTDADADSDADTDADSDADADSDTDTDPVASGDPLPDGPVLDLGVLADLTDQIDGILAGETVSAYVVDLENGEVVYENEPDLPLKPASNTKLFTTVTAMGMLGEDARMRMAAYAPAAPDGSGRVASLTVLVEHDSSWSAYVYADEFFAADRLADRLYERGVRSVTGALTLAGEVVVDGSSVGTYDAASNRNDGVAVLEDALLNRGIAVGSTATSATLTTPSGVLLASRESPPLHVLAGPINIYSHNEMADALARHDGWELYGTSTYAAGADAIYDFVGGLGVDVSDLNFADGSGLSHDNRVTARSIVDLQLAMKGHPAGQAWERSFSVAGVVGTIGSRLSGADTLGRVWAKTGTLSDTIALSGILYNKYDGHRYVFGLVLNDVTDQTAARSTLDAVVRALAVDLRDRGTRPAAPALTTLRNPGDGSLVATWTPVSSATGYALWVSDDGRVWDRADATYEDGPTAVITGVSTSRPTYVRVQASNAQGYSEESNVLAATAGSAVPRVLIVDGNDRWRTQDDNPRGAGGDFVVPVAECVGNRAIESAGNEAVIDGTVDLADYDAVLWLLGEESTADKTFDGTERQLVTAYLQDGGALLVSGAEVGWELDYLGDSGTKSFYNGTLHATYAADGSDTFSALPVAGRLFDGVGELGFYTPARLQVWYPDVVTPTGGAVSELVYTGGSAGTAAISYSGTYKLVYFAFPVESVDAIEQREVLIDRSLGFFGL